MKLSCIQTKEGTQHAGYSRGRKIQQLQNEGLLMLATSFCKKKLHATLGGNILRRPKTRKWRQTGYRPRHNKIPTKTRSSDQLSSRQFSKSTLLPPKI